MNRTLIFIKPDGVRRKLVGKLINRFEENNLDLIAMKLIKIPKKLAEKHYAEHKGKEFYDRLIKFVTSGPSIAIILEGNDIIPKVRELVGATNPAEALPNTIRGDFREDPVKSVTENMIHASDSIESAEREISLFFGKKYL